jgi:putative (di)nucleoside polyphosphate hydrolase
MLVNEHGKVFVGQRIDNPDSDAWQMPQGGMDDGEDVIEAGLRELAEETGISETLVTLITKTREEVFYDLPPELVGTLWKGRYRGQRQHWILLRFRGQDGDIDINADDKPEFSQWQWAEPEKLPDMIVPFKRRVYRAVLEQFRDLI